jgi:rhodanese-related sulfurtransferase
MKTISRNQARELIDNRDDLTVVEVLGEEYFNKFHLPGAHHVPLDESFAENIQAVAPDPSRPVLVYCLDTECDAAPRAARKMEQLGYTRVFDYEAGKADWKEAGLPIERPSGVSA